MKVALILVVNRSSKALRCFAEHRLMVHWHFVEALQCFWVGLPSAGTLMCYSSEVEEEVGAILSVSEVAGGGRSVSEVFGCLQMVQPCFWEWGMRTVVGAYAELEAE